MIHKSDIFYTILVPVVPAQAMAHVYRFHSEMEHTSAPVIQDILAIIVK